MTVEEDKALYCNGISDSLTTPTPTPKPQEWLVWKDGEPIGFVHLLPDEMLKHLEINGEVYAKERRNY